MEEKKRRGPKPKHTGPYVELHVKFSGEMLAHIQQVVGDGSYQAYFDRLVQQDMQMGKAKTITNEK